MISSMYAILFKHSSTLCKLSKLTKMFFGQFILILFASTYFVATELSEEILEKFSCEGGNKLVNVVVHKTNGWVYCGCVSYIHRLSSKMEPLEKYSSCTLDDIKDSNCGFIVLLEMDYKNQYLISCSSLGHCLAHSENNISKIIFHEVELALEVKENALQMFKRITFQKSTETSLTEINDSWDIEENDTLTTFVGVTLSPMFSTPFSVLYLSNWSTVSLRSLNPIPNTFGLIMGQVDVCTETICRIVYGFSWRNFGYLLTINKTFHSHIVQIDYQKGTCSWDIVAIVCRRNESETYREFRAVAFAFASNLTAEDALIGIFKLLDTYNDIDKHVICIYSMNEINGVFAIQSTQKSNGQTGKTLVLKAQSLHYSFNYNFNMASVSTVVGLVNNHYVLFIGLFGCSFIKISISTLSHRVQEYYSIFKPCDYEENITHLYGNDMWLYGRNDLNKLYKIQVYNCYQHNTSFSCLAIQNPYCGWCFFTSKCCVKSECLNNGVSTNWVSYDYVALAHTSKSKFPLNIQTNVTLVFAKPLPFANHTIIFCMFKFNDYFAVNTTTAICNDNTNSSNIINCTTPLSVFIPKELFDLCCMTAHLSLATNDFPKLLQNIPIKFYNCQNHKTCLACLASIYPCTWNMDERRCADKSTWRNNNNTHKFVLGKYDTISTTLHQYNRNPKFCPTFKFKTMGDGLSEIIIPSDLANHTKQVVEVQINITEVLKDQKFTCNFSITDTSTNISRLVLTDATKSCGIVIARMFQCMLTCPIETLVNNIDKAVTEVELKISSYDKRINLEKKDKRRLVLLSCAKIGNYCEKCIRVYQCGWCSAAEQCSEKLLCNHAWIKENHECKANYAIIDSFRPKESIVNDDTIVSIFTRNRIEDFLPFNCSITVSGVLCNNSVVPTNDYPNTLLCKLQQFDSTIHNFSGPVIVNCSTGISIAKNNFTFFDPQVNDIIPNNGPKCGGTVLTIYGNRLNIGGPPKVLFNDLECVTFDEHSDRLKCITSPSKTSFRSKAVIQLVGFGNINRTSENVTFYYDQNMKADDAIHRVPRGIPAGGIDIYVSGENLTSYGEVALVVQANMIGDATVFSMCQILNTTFMICPSPKLEEWDHYMNIIRETSPMQLNYTFSYPPSNKTKRRSIHELETDPTKFPIPKLYPKFLLYPNSLQSAILEIDETQQTNWMIENIHFIIIGTIMPVALILAVIVIKFRRMAKTSKKMQRRINKMGLETIAMSQWIKRVVIEKNIELDENEQIMLKLPNVTIEPTTVPRVTDDQVLQEMEYELPLDNVWEFDRSNLALGKCLGQGEFGIVVKGKATGIVEQNIVTTVAVKMLKSIHTDIDMVCLVSEMELMKLIARRRHDNVLCLLGCCTQNGPLLVITEYAPFGNLLDFLRKHEFATTDEVMPGQLNNKMLINFALQVAKGMDHLASIRCIHRDLAARNILITENYTMKISDFGLARDVRGKYYYQQKSNARVPVRWMAPEAIHRGRNTTKSDVWSYGILFWEIVTLGCVPYSSFVDVNKLLQAINSGYRMEKPKNCSMEMYEVMRRCWNNQPDDRPTFTEIVVLLEEMLENAEVCEPKDVLLE